MSGMCKRKRGLAKNSSLNVPCEDPGMDLNPACETKVGFEDDQHIPF